MTQPTQEQLSAMKKIALVIDNEVVDVLHCDERLAAILLSDATMIDITERVLTETIKLGYSYNVDSDTFTE
jgi:hypothetical protein